MSKKSILSSIIKYLRTCIRYISYAVTALVVVAYLLAAFSPYIPPYRFVFPALMGLAFPIILMAMLLTTLYWLLRLRWQILLGLAIVYALSWHSISAYFPINRGATSERLANLGEQRPLKILSYNVCAFGLSHHSLRKPNRSLLYIKSSEADIVCLQEAALAANKDWGVTLGQIEAYLGSKYPYIRAVESQPGGSTLMLLSRYPIRSAERLDIPSSQNGAVAFEVDIEGRPTTVINLHLESFRLNSAIGKEYMNLVAQGEAFELREAMQAKLGPTFRQRNLQANIINEYIQTKGKERIIVCGDFNDTPVSYALAKIGEGLKNTYTESGNGLGVSFRSRYFKVRIDHILVGKVFRPIFTEVDAAARGSDHYPIYTYVLDEGE